MKIVFVANYPLDSSCIRGGVEASVYGLAQEMGKTNEVLVADIPRVGLHDGCSQDGRVRVMRFENRGKRNINSVSRVDDIKAWILCQQVDVCHFHGTGAVVHSLYKALRKENMNLVLTVHGLIHIEKLNALRKGFSIKKWIQLVYQSKVEFSLLSKCPKVIVDTEYVKKMIIGYKQQAKISKLPEIEVIPQGVDGEFYNHNCALDSKVILSVGTFTARKGHLLLLDAFERMANSVPESNLVIAGAVADESYYTQVKDYVSRSKYRERISVFPDVDRRKMMELYENACVFALHTEEESQGIVFAEAMAVGLPVVTTMVGGVPNIIRQGENGLLSEYGNIAEFSANLEMVLRNKDLRMIMSEKGHIMANNYHWSAISKHIIEVYH